MDDGQIIDLLGGNGAVAKLCEVSPQAVWQWRRDGIPRARLLYLRAIRPGAFADRPSHDAADKPEVA